MNEKFLATLKGVGQIRSDPPPAEFRTEQVKSPTESMSELDPQDLSWRQDGDARVLNGPAQASAVAPEVAEKLADGPMGDDCICHHPVQDPKGDDFMRTGGIEEVGETPTHEAQMAAIDDTHVEPHVRASWRTDSGYLDSFVK